MNVSTPLAALRTRAGVEVNVAVGCPAVLGEGAWAFGDAILAAQKSDVTLLFLGGSAKGGFDHTVHYDTTEKESLDRREIGLPGLQLDLLKALLKKTTTPIVLVMMQGGPIDIALADASPQVGSILQVGYPGQAGGDAVADLLLGVVSPAGRMPVTTYFSNYTAQSDMRSMDMRAFPGRTHRFLQVPVLYEFGFGLSYAKFEYRALSLTPRAAAASASRTVTLDVVNVGDVASDESVLVYAASRSGDPRHVRNLIWFKRLHDVQPGMSVRVRFTLSASELQVAAGGDAPGDAVRWHVPAGEWVLTTSACDSAAAARDTAALVGGNHPCALKFSVTA